MSVLVQIFNNHELGFEVRTVDRDGETWFVAKDVAEILGYSNTRDAIARHCRCVAKHDVGVETGKKRDGSPAMQEIAVTIIPERDVYRLVMRSNLPEAERFEEWVVSEVLPSIRKRGVYATDELIEKTLTDPDYGIAVLTRLKAERKKTQAIQETVDQEKPKD
jgi:anti-repressor protein